MPEITRSAKLPWIGGTDLQGQEISQGDHGI
jgi:hypothetical protein